MCRTLEVSRSGFYAWLGRGESGRTRDNRRLTALIRGIFEESRSTYGAPRVHQTLLQRGEPCGYNRVARLMRAADLRSKTKRRFRIKTTDSKHGHPIALSEQQQQPGPRARHIELAHKLVDDGALGGDRNRGIREGFLQIRGARNKLVERRQILFNLLRIAVFDDCVEECSRVAGRGRTSAHHFTC